jgi:hypothetical protein
MEVGNVLFCCLIMCWQLAASRTLFSALRKAMWDGLKKCNMSRGLGKALWVIAKNQMSLHNAIWAKFVRLTRAQNKIDQYSVQQTFREWSKNNTKT